MDLEIRHLRLVLAIAETGSVTRAGEKLHLTQSALSHQLRDAERQLGKTLFERSHGRMTLTSAGRRLLRTAQSVLAELQQAEGEIRQGTAEEEGRIRLATECYTAYHWLPGRLKLFLKKFPAVDFQIAVEATDCPVDALLEGKLDVAITSSVIRNRKIEYTPLFEDEVLVTMHPEHRLANHAFVAPEDLADEELILYPPKEKSSVLKKVLAPAGVKPRRIHEVTFTETILEMVRAGVGVAALARWIAGPYLESGAIVGLPLTEAGMRRKWSAAQISGRRTPEYVKEFIRLLAEQPLTQNLTQGRTPSKMKGRRVTVFRQGTAVA